MENVISVVGAAMVVAIMGAFVPFEFPMEVSIPKPTVIQVVSTPKVDKI